METVDFLHCVTDLTPSITHRAIALLWWYGRDDPAQGATPRELRDAFESAGYARPNVTRLAAALRRDTRTRRGPGGTFRLHPDARRALDEEYEDRAGSRPIPISSVVLPRELFVGTRGYIEKVVAQLNASYEYSLFDCCAVMCRRLLETLIIEVYEGAGRAEEIKDQNGHFFMFDGLLKHLENDRSLNLGRNAITGLKDFKRLGDQSAHNRRFNARKSDIDRVGDGLRVVAEELLHLANLAKPPLQNPRSSS